MECTGDECASPSATIDPYSVLPNPDEWPDAPGWMYVMVYILIAVMVVAVLVTAVAAIATWRRRTAKASEREVQAWVDLATAAEVSRGGVGGAREQAASDGGATPDGGAGPDGGPGMAGPGDDAPPTPER